MKARILIVGGGAMGTSIALHAASRTDPLREPVVLIEKNTLGAGSSGLSSGIVHQTYSDRAMAGMARDAVKAYSGFEQSTGRSVGYRRTGVLLIAGTDEARVTKLRTNVEMQLEIGIDVRWVDAEEIRALVPGIEVSDDAVGAYEPGGGFIHPGRAIGALAALARSKGAITRVGIANPRILIEGGRAVGVETDAGKFFAPQVVLATGPWTRRIASELGVELPLSIARTDDSFVQMPVPGQDNPDETVLPPLPGAETLIVDRDLLETRFYTTDPTDHLPVPHPVLVDFANGYWARPHPGLERTRVGRLGWNNLREVDDSDSPDRLDRAADPEFDRWAHAAISRRLPVYTDMPTVDSQPAFVTLTPDHRPIVGPVESIPGLFVAAGFTGNDFHLAPSIGEGMAQLLLGQPVSAFDPELFSLTRFATRV